MDLAFILPFLAVVLVGFMILKILALPMKLIIKLLVNALIGGIILWVINLIGAGFGFAVILNWITAIVVGTLGIPGVILVVLFQIFFL
ncbi:MAG: pro-sigmaK processing inhibitor BofA family protein [Clostridia bacterium]